VALAAGADDELTDPVLGSGLPGGIDGGEAFVAVSVTIEHHVRALREHAIDVPADPSLSETSMAALTPPEPTALEAHRPAEEVIDDAVKAPGQTRIARERRRP